MWGSHFLKFRVLQWLWRRGWDWASASSKTKTSHMTCQPAPGLLAARNWRNMDVKKLWNWMVFLLKKWATQHGCQCDKNATRANTDGSYSWEGHQVFFGGFHPRFHPEKERMFMERGGRRWTKPINMPWGSYFFFFPFKFSGPKRNPQNPCSGMQKLADNFSVQQCLWIKGLSALMTNTTDQCDGRETS